METLKHKLHILYVTPVQYEYMILKCNIYTIQHIH